MDQSNTVLTTDNVLETARLNNYKMGEIKWGGTFGKVMEATHILSGENVAIKIIDKKSLKDQDDRQRVDRQVEIMKIIRHPNIVQFYEKIETDDKIYLVMEYVENGELFKLMSDEGRLNERAAGRIFIQLMNAVQYLHRLGIAHRDLKPENILLDVDYNVKLIDFGLSNFAVKGQYLHTACGSPCYAPPEMVSGNKYQGQIGDVWSMGIILYGMICGSLPFQQNTTKELYKKVIEGFYVIPSDITLEATEAIRKMLVTDPTKRITIPQLRKIPFFKNLRQVEPKIIGIVIGFHPMPIDSQIIEKMKKLVNFDRAKIEDEIKQNEHTSLTALYYLLQKQSLKSGNKTVVDLQYFLESSERYRNEYGILPEQLRDESMSVEREQSSQSIKTVKNSKVSNGYTLSTKGLSKHKRQQIEIVRKEKPIKSSRKTEKSARYQKKDEAEQLFNSIKKYRIEKNEQKAENKTVQMKGNLSTERPRRLMTLRSGEKDRQKNSKSKESQHLSSNKSRKKSQKKQKEDKSKLALKLWDTYMQKQLQTTKKKESSLGKPSHLKIKQKQADRAFNSNIQKLKEGFLKLPFMKKGKNEEHTISHKTEQNKSIRKPEMQPSKYTIS